MRLEGRFRSAVEQARRAKAEAAAGVGGAVKEVRAQGEKALQEAREKVRHTDPEPGRFTVASARVAPVSQAAKATLGDVGQRLGTTKGATHVSRLVVQGAALVAQMPLLSLVPDVINERNGVSILVDRAKDAPDDVHASLWLGEALRAQERDFRLYRRMRGVVNPAAFIGGEALRAAARMGSASSGSASEVFLRHALDLAMRRIADDPRDAEAHHVVARYYLAAGRPEGGLPAAKAAVVLASGALCGQALVTLARTYFALGHTAAARTAALGAVHAGCSVGHEVLADVMFRASEDGDAKAGGVRAERIREYARARARVSPSDRVAYYGVYRTTSETAWGVASSQFFKVRRQLENARAVRARLGGRGRGRTEEEHAHG